MYSKFSGEVGENVQVSAQWDCCGYAKSKEEACVCESEFEELHICSLCVLEVCYEC